MNVFEALRVAFAGLIANRLRSSLKGATPWS